ncbi:Fe-S oxidoreductase [Dimargaris cristalligena]|uniref:S-adenosyl-L-methionine-dependent tRNA 4-demethylwyosine synthase n=1 Tax=Dimargaris cristalligena TaxID=215637 RepID=A0A4V1J5I0_9FUNG|nr:Fe-S oxidoreductase [Dimargaris cristalligena]RKP39129.1 hypothetical protein BJ085DRAFT_39426 [Dimargaris cristalligena]|eukprot:RKP39129.1 hypothetical protein BJ085DRAFT_39426 [Dimargaris cristalligena]
MSCSAGDSPLQSEHCNLVPETAWYQSPWATGALTLAIASYFVYHQIRHTIRVTRKTAAKTQETTPTTTSPRNIVPTTLPKEKCAASPDSPTSESPACCRGAASPTACQCPSSALKDPATREAILSTYYHEAPLKIFTGGQTGTAQKFSQLLKEQLASAGKIPAVIQDIAEYDTESFFTEKAVCVFLLATYNVENPTEWFLKWLEDAKYDFRLGNECLAHLRFAVFGLGDSAYGDEFGIAGRNTDRWLGSLGARRMYPLGEGDKNEDQLASFEAWTQGLLSTLLDPEAYTAPIEADARISDAEDEDENEEDTTPDNKDVLGGSDGEMVDLEDMGGVARRIQEAREQRRDDEASFAASQTSRVTKRPYRPIGEGAEARPVRAPRAMVSPMIHQNLTKQGYKVIGSHSGVKICRWTKAALRGRGFCYKHSFYGIQSHLCMETTPSLACANKCVFCWRHHTNPVGTEWRWQMDDPGFILEGALQNHYQMIKQLKGVPGVKADRFQEAFQVKHCALSLVGEPIMYPRINEFIRMLHEQNISSFLVTNAQFPDAIADLDPVTQLYVSVDASTKESLKKVDRPLFRDFWERFLDSLDALRAKGQRTVYRLTLVKDYNTEELANYVELIQRGRPEFIEIKGVTFCGFSGASNLSMQNVPYHNEVVHFVQKLVSLLGDEYGIACEHAHSCSILVAHTKFHREGRWHTWIDYAKFQQLVKSGASFNSLDFTAPTPDWAVFGNEHHGFDPSDTRFYRKKGGKSSG